MDMKSKKPVRQALGRGLSALISSPRISVVPPSGANTAEIFVPEESRNIPHAAERGVTLQARYIPIQDVYPNPEQPRKHFSDAELAELSASIKELGLIQPILVRRSPDPGRYQIVAGERRWRAAKLANLAQIPVLIDDLADREALEVALVENVQRESLNPVEEAQAYKRLADEFSLSQAEIAQKVGKDRTSVTNLIRLLTLPEPVLAMIRKGELSTGHAKAILSVKEPSAQISLAKKSVNENLSVRALENLISRVVVLDAGKRVPTPMIERGQTANISPHINDVLEKLRRALGTKVSVKHHTSGKGKIEVEYFSEQELERIVDHICTVTATV